MPRAMLRSTFSTNHGCIVDHDALRQPRDPNSDSFCLIEMPSAARIEKAPANEYREGDYRMIVARQALQETGIRPPPRGGSPMPIFHESLHGWTG